MTTLIEKFLLRLWIVHGARINFSGIFGAYGEYALVAAVLNTLRVCSHNILFAVQWTQIPHWNLVQFCDDYLFSNCHSLTLLTLQNFSTGIFKTAQNGHVQKWLCQRMVMSKNDYDIHGTYYPHWNGAKPCCKTTTKSAALFSATGNNVVPPLGFRPQSD